jgi:UDP-GlcNAc:undecaprenyl-phosphate GlcNAc-1-phosphate transferase
MGIITIPVIFLFSLAALVFFRKVAKKIGLVDKPDYRKHHYGAIPLVGGISVYVSLCFVFLIADGSIPHFGLYLICAGPLVLVGALDDRFDISVKVRIVVQAIVAIVMMMFSDNHLQSFGHIFGSVEVTLGSFGYVVTLFAVWAAINAFNMIDGIDGLLGGLSSVAFAALAILLWLNERFALAFWCIAMIISLTPYILLNLGFLGRRYKVFMGDAGSTLLGFTLIWLLVQTSQGSNPVIKPVTALWVIAIPLMDMTAIMYRRLRKGMSPFSPDRQHIHHLIMRAGFTARQAFILITLVAGILAVAGITGDYLNLMPEWVMLLLFFMIYLLLYGYCMKRAGMLVHFIERIKHNAG